MKKGFGYLRSIDRVKWVSSKLAGLELKPAELKCEGVSNVSLCLWFGCIVAALRARCCSGRLAKLDGVDENCVAC